MIEENHIQTKVLIVGAGPTGLALAIELGSRSIPCILIERNDRAGHAPRAKTTNVRTREHLRRWGIADRLAAASPLGLDYPSHILFVTRLGGHRLAKFEHVLDCKPDKNPHFSEHAQWIPQYLFEEVLKNHAQSLPCVDIRFSTAFESFEQNDDGVLATIRSRTTGGTQTVHCDYLVGADGARSMVRELIGAKMSGTYGLSRNYNIVFRAPGLATAHDHGPGIMYWQVNADVPSLIGPMDKGDKWFFMPTNVPKDFKLTDDEAAALIRKATGIDLPYEVLSTDEWVASRLIADKYRDRRVFLAGDACHLHPPMGGYGMNMGVADGVDLGWKIAAVLEGWGGSALLDSYESERRPVHGFVMDEAVANHSVLGPQLFQSGIEDDTPEGEHARLEAGQHIQQAKAREFLNLRVVLGYHYGGSALVMEDGTTTAQQNTAEYTASARPGSLAPHAWLDDGSSLYDGFGKGFTLLIAGEADAHDLSRAAANAAEAGVPLAVHAPAHEGLAQLYEARYALIRPDQHVAWRGNAWPEDGKQVFLRVTGR
ncbi:FAD-dependent monooxygenase (plasmid) [Paraburkholderia sp. D15]|uniref:FAD-dependent monooxygenase n=1 Tax=Paraburkholderia sp. D15 TaxID=2880218 RepID=UPI002478C775|nr:FAD-dependent monooxygenase [Paraburkholderia sp. D15]WGS55137.1 FAD-dependent monooxygenase [Paraburkholderia sp. D15]